MREHARRLTAVSRPLVSSTTRGSPLRGLWRQRRPVHWLTMHEQLTLGIARLALIDVPIEYEIVWFDEAAEWLVSDRGRQRIEGRIREPGSQPTARTYALTHLGYGRRPHPRRRGLDFRLGSDDMVQLR